MEPLYFYSFWKETNRMSNDNNNNNKIMLDKRKYVSRKSAKVYRERMNEWKKKITLFEIEKMGKEN